MGKSKTQDPLICSECAKLVAGEAWMEMSQSYRDKVIHYGSPRCESCGKRESAFKEVTVEVKPIRITTPSYGGRDDSESARHGVLASGTRFGGT